LDPGSVKKIRIRIRDEQPRSYFQELRKPLFWVKILELFDADPVSGIKKIQIRDPGWKKFGSGINIPDPQNCTYPKLFL
jgi:hypothetical protein